VDILLTHGRSARTRSFHLEAWQIVLMSLLAFLLMLVLAGAIYHLIFMKAVRENWPVIGDLVRLIAKDEFAARDKFLRENLDAMAHKVGEMQAKMVKLDAVGSRVAGLAGLKPEDLKAIESAVAASASASAAEPITPPAASAPAKPASSTVSMIGAISAQGGPYIPSDAPAFDFLNQLMDRMDEVADHRSDVFTLAESRLLEKKLEALVLPSSTPVIGPIGSGFGFRVDPLTGRSALHTGLDFPAHIGTPIRAAAGGVVISTLTVPSYGQMVEIDHGNRLITRYAHTSQVLVNPGQLIKRGQQIAMVGNTGRSTGPHLHFEVLYDGVPQDPRRFLARGEKAEAGPQHAAAAPKSAKKRKTR
jgi:murein DD-endopeptidase MepM/ murein hydrolase activator NlpD